MFDLLIHFDSLLLNLLFLLRLTFWLVTLFNVFILFSEEERQMSVSKNVQNQASQTQNQSQVEQFEGKKRASLVLLVFSRPETKHLLKQLVAEDPST